MANKDDVLRALDMLHQNRPQKVFGEIQKNEMGVFAVIKYLNDAEGDVNSAEISKALGISSARMAVLMRKLEAKGFIIKSQSKTDARSSTVKLSENGKTLAENIKTQMFKAVEKIIDEFGIDELKNLLEKLNTIKTIMEEFAPMKMEDLND